MVIYRTFSHFCQAHCYYTHLDGERGRQCLGRPWSVTWWPKFHRNWRMGEEGMGFSVLYFFQGGSRRNQGNGSWSGQVCLGIWLHQTHEGCLVRWGSDYHVCQTTKWCRKSAKRTSYSLNQINVLLLYLKWTSIVLWELSNVFILLKCLSSFLYWPWLKS